MEWTIFNKKKLLQDLKRFGLNPSEWQILTPLAGHKQPQVLRHIKDSQFSLLGIPLTDDQSLQWAELQVLSI